jgi:hypothetical protein
MGLDYENVVTWEGRPKRARKPPPLTYWDEYVATDPWYLQELVADIPDDEMQAAIEDEDWEADSIVSEGGEEEYASSSSSEGWDDEADECAAMDDGALESADECSDECTDDECSESTSTDDDACSSDSESAHATGKRQRRG